MGLERLQRRLQWLKASRRRYRLNRLKRRREQTLPPSAPIPESASAGSDPPPPPVAKKPRPSYLLPKRPLPSATSSPKANQSQRGATGGGEVAKREAGGGGQGCRQKGKKGAKGGQVAKDQRVVVMIPPKIQAPKPPQASRETARDVPPRREEQTLPHNPTREPTKRGRSLSKSRQDQAAAEKRRRERRGEYPRQRSPSPSTSHRRPSLPPSLPTPFSMNAEEVQWMVTAIASAFEAQQRFRQQQQQQQEQEQPPQPHHSRSRSTSRKGKGPGKGKGGGRGR